MKPTPPHSLAFLRIAFGLAMVWEIGRYFAYGWIDRYFIDPEFHFTYLGFGWVHPWPGAGMKIHFAALGLLAALLALGWFQRLVAGLFCSGFTYVFLLDQARYLNHFYLIVLLSLLFAVVPADRAWTVPFPGIRPSRIPIDRWGVRLFRVQVGVVYFFGGIAKLNGDWLSGRSAEVMLLNRAGDGLPTALATSGAATMAMTWGGLLLDLLVVPGLMWRKSRPWVFATAVAFHLTNARVFSIGIFPWLMIAATTIFFAPGWPLRWIPGRQASREILATGRPTGRVGRFLAVGYVVVQLVLPLRHFAYPGNVSWTEEGHRFAWHMKLRVKESDTVFSGTFPGTGLAWEVRPEEVLPAWQARVAGGSPEMLVQLGKKLAEDFGREGRRAEVRVRARVSLNGHPHALLIHPGIDLGRLERSVWPAGWILPHPEETRHRLDAPGQASYNGRVGRGNSRRK